MGAGCSTDRSTEVSTKDEQGRKGIKEPTVSRGTAGNPASGGKSPKKQTGKMSWHEVLDYIAEEDLWHGVKREDRQEWAACFTEADRSMRKPRRTLPKDITEAIINGDIGQAELSNLPTAQPKVIVFVSSTFTDTKTERNLLMRDVYPYLRSLCRRLGMDFGTADMRWGVREEATLEHNTVAMCTKEIQRCIRESAGPAFLCILGQKYGYRPLPAEIEQQEFESMLTFLNKNGNDTSTLNAYYRLDTNAITAEYVLRPRTAEDSNWWDVVEELTELLRLASSNCFGEDADRLEKYNISVTHTEINVGAYDNPAKKEQGLFVRRELKDITSDRHLNRQLIDMSGDVIDRDAQEKLETLKNVELVENMLQDIVLEFDYETADIEECEEYIRSVCDQVCRKFTQQILKNYEEHLHVEDDAIFQEALQHRQLALDKCSLFVGREDALKKITGYVDNMANEDKIFAVHGRSGCGKTALVAVAAKTSRERHTSSVFVLRFLGTTSQSGSARSLLHSICTQITRAYGKDPSEIPDAYKELIAHFKMCLTYADSSRPLIIFLDSLDQLSNEDFGQNLSWLPLRDNLPPHVKIVTSCIPTNCFEVLQDFLPETHCMEVTPLELSQGPEILDKMLAQQNRKVTKDQEQVVLKAFSNCPFPLFLRLAADIALRWKSYDVVKPDAVADDMPGLITTLFQRLESRYGDVFVQRALAYITAANQGLSLTELEDILSCDDVVLDSVFEWWTPPFRRIPPLLWARIRSELGVYLVERGADGVSAYNWYHRQFWETAVDRYLDKPLSPGENKFRMHAHEAIADYFEGKWTAGMMYQPRPTKDGKAAAATLEDRQVPKQPIILSGERGSPRQINRRKLNEVPYNLIQLKAWDRLITFCRDLHYLEAKFEAGFGYQCLGELREATRESGVNDELQRLTRFVGANLAFLLRESDAVYQVTSQLPPSNPLRSMLNNIATDSLPKPLLRSTTQADFNDPCEITMMGHAATIRCCDYSPQGDLIASSSDDTTLRLWDTITGAELVTIGDLPAPVFPSKGERIQLMLHPVNPCCFNRTGDIIGAGTEHGEVILWDTSGRQIQKTKVSNPSPCTFACFSPAADIVLATSFKNGQMCVWEGEGLSPVFSTNVGGESTGLSFSSDGCKLAVCLLEGLVLFETSDGANIRHVASGRGQAALSLCCTFHPGGEMVATGADDSAVGIWDVRNEQCTLVHSLRNFHRAWIWSIKFTKCGRFMFTCSSDRSMKMWSCQGPVLPGDGWTTIKTVGGHSHRVSMIALKPGAEDKFVTSSLDNTLKLWDLKTVKTGTLPPTGSLHYSICSATPSGRYLTTCVGWSLQCSIIDLHTKAKVSATSNHPGFLIRAEYSADESKVITLDTGHKGDYHAGASKAAKLNVCSIPNGQLIKSLSVPSPTIFSRGTTKIAVGTEDGEVYLFNTETLDEIHHWNCGASKVTTVACSPNDQHVLTTIGETGCVWNTCNKELHAKLADMDTNVYQSRYTTQGDHLITGTGSGKLYIWNATRPDYALLKILTSHTGYLKDIQFSATCSFMVTSADLSARVWDVKQGFSLKAVYYGPVNCASMIGEDIVAAGEASGKLEYLKF